MPVSAALSLTGVTLEYPDGEGTLIQFTPHGDRQLKGFHPAGSARGEGTSHYFFDSAFDVIE